MLRRTVFVVTALALVATSTSALAEGARLGAAQGGVYANRGGQMVPVSAGSVLRTGDRVVAVNAATSVAYADGCNVAIPARSMVTIADSSPCAGGSSNIIRVQNGGGDGYDNRGLGLYLLGGAVALGLVGAALNDDNGAPASP